VAPAGAVLAELTMTLPPSALPLRDNWGENHCWGYHPRLVRKRCGTAGCFVLFDAAGTTPLLAGTAARPPTTPDLVLG